MEALENCGVSVTVQGSTLLTDRRDYQGAQKFVWTGESYQFSYDSHEYGGRVVSRAVNRGYTPVSQFLSKLETAYKQAYQNKLARIAEAERQRLEQERLARVEATRQKAIEKAKAQGYQVQEYEKNGTIQLVLTRTVY